MRRITSLVFGVALLAGVAGLAHAQETIAGRVASVDSTGRIISLTDGRMIVLEPGTRVMINGREVAPHDIKPGANLTVVRGGAPTSPQAAAPYAVTTQPSVTTQPAPAPLAAHPPVTASGVVSSVDQRSGVITFLDGRQVFAGTGAQVWEPSALASVRPGEHVLVQGAAPVAAGAASPSWFSSSAPAHYVTGNVMRVDRATDTVVLDDGTVVHVHPTTRYHGMNGQQMTVADLQPGSVVVVRVMPAPAAQSGVTVAQPGVTGTQPRASIDSAGSALPREALGPAIVNADDVLIVHPRQAP